LNLVSLNLAIPRKTPKTVVLLQRNAIQTVVYATGLMAYAQTTPLPTNHFVLAQRARRKKIAAGVLDATN